MASRTSAFLLCTLTGALFFTSASAHAAKAAAADDEAKAFQALADERNCDAANLFAEANIEAPHIDLVFNAALASQLAGDNLRARRLFQSVASSSSRHRDHAVLKVKELDATLASGPGTLCAGEPIAAIDRKTLVERVRELEFRVAKLAKKPRGGRPPRKEQTAAYDLPVQNSAVRGASGGDIDVVVFTDYQCPFCSRIHPMLKSLAKDPRTKGRVRLVYKHFPLSFHKDAKPAAKAALAAREQGEVYFWKMSEKMFDNQRGLKSEKFSVFAQEIGLDVKRFERDLRNRDAEYEAEIKRDTKLGSTNAKVRGTPSVFVNGWELRTRTLEGILETANGHSGDHPAPEADSAFVHVRTK